MAGVRLKQLTPACSIFDLEDRFARERGVRGKHPRPIGTVKYWLIGRVVSSVQSDFETPIRLLTVRNPSGYDLFFDRVEQKGAAATRMAFEESSYVLKIEAQFYQDREHEIPLPQSDSAHSIDLEPSYAYPFPTAGLSHGGGPTLLRGTVHATNGAGVEGVTITVSSSSSTYVTDATGQWVLIFAEDQPNGDVTVRFVWPDSTVVNVPAVPITGGQQRSLAQAGLRGWVMNDAGIGIPGARVHVLGHAGESLSAQDGRWFFYFGLNQPDELVSVSVDLIDGRTATQDNVQVRSRSVVIVPTFSFA